MIFVGRGEGGGGRLSRERSILGLLLVYTSCMHGVVRCTRLHRYDILSWVDVYLDSGCSKSDDIPLFNVSVWKGDRELSNGDKEKQRDGEYDEVYLEVSQEFWRVGDRGTNKQI